MTGRTPRPPVRRCRPPSASGCAGHSRGRSLNWLVAAGLDACGLGADARRVRQDTLELCDEGELNEYFDAERGTPLGAAGFSWTAALALHLAGGEERRS